MSRVILGNLLYRNPSSISTTDLMPPYGVFQPLDGTAIPVSKYDRISITLHWDRVGGLELSQIINIIQSSQIDNSREHVELYYNDNHILDGYVVITDYTITPVAGTGDYYQELTHPHHIFVQQDAAVDIVLMPVEYKLFNKV